MLIASELCRLVGSVGSRRGDFKGDLSLQLLLGSELFPAIIEDKVLDNAPAFIMGKKPHHFLI